MLLIYPTTLTHLPRGDYALWRACPWVASYGAPLLALSPLYGEQVFTGPLGRTLIRVAKSECPRDAASRGSSLAGSP